MKLDVQTLEEYGSVLLKLKMYPYFDIAHYILMCLAVREDIQTYQSTIPNFHKRHPLACYLSSMILCFGGGILVHFLLGEPILEDFKHHQNLVLATACWYLVFFSPFDTIYKLIKLKPVKITLSVLKELQRSRKIYDGVNHGYHLYPNSFIIIVVCGAIKGAGSGFLTIIERFNRGIYLPNTNETLHPSFATKGCLLAAIAFTLERKDILNVSKTAMFFGVATIFVYVKIMSIFFKSFDPIVPFENLSSAVFFGGIMDALRKASRNQSAVNQKTKENKNDQASVDVDSKKIN